MTTRHGQSEIGTLRQQLNALVRTIGPHAVQKTLCGFLWLVVFVSTLSAQVLTPEILATVPILPARLETQRSTRVALMGKCAVWRDILVGIEKSGDSLVFWEPHSMRVISRVALPSELTPLSHISATSDRHSLACLIGKNPPYTFTELKFSGTAVGGYRFQSARHRGTPLTNADGTMWRNGVIAAWAFAPDGRGFWVAAEETGTTGKKTSLWRFRRTSGPGGDLKCVAEEVFSFAEPNQETSDIGGLAWWPSGLLVAAMPQAVAAQSRPSVTLLLLPWGNGNSLAVLARGIAKGLVATDLADSPATLWLVLWDPAHGEYALAPVPKVYPRVR